MVHDDLDDDFFRLPPPHQPGTPARLPTLREMEERYIQRVLQQTDGSRQLAANILGISRWSLARRLRRTGAPPRSPHRPPGAPARLPDEET